MTFDAVSATWFVLDTSLRAAGAAAAVAVVLHVFRVKGAAEQHSAWTAVLVSMLLMPLLPSIVPPLPVPGFPVANSVPRTGPEPDGHPTADSRSAAAPKLGHASSFSAGGRARWSSIPPSRGRKQRS